MSRDRPRVLFFAEGATLAHVGRPILLANSLDPERHEIHFARPASHAWVTSGATFQLHDLDCQDGATFARRLEHGQPLYDLATLQRYVDEDLALLDALRPDVVVGDFRLSLSVSARLRGVPYINVCDAYWSPEQALDPPLPVLGLTRFLPIPLAGALFRLAAPLALRLHAIPMERLRARHGLPSLRYDLRRCYTDADLRLFANFPQLYPGIRPGLQAAFIGPIAWSPPSREHAEYLAAHAARIYVTMGSSGDPAVLAMLLPVLDRLGLPVVVAGAGKSLPTLSALKHTRVFDFLPGDLACRQAALVVCNGGSPTTNQALTAGVPVLGIARNMDQFLNMRAIEAFGAGLAIRADRASPTRLAVAIERLLMEPRFKVQAEVLAKSTTGGGAIKTLPEHIQALLSCHHRPFGE